MRVCFSSVSCNLPLPRPCACLLSVQGPHAVHDLGRHHHRARTGHRHGRGCVTRQRRRVLRAVSSCWCTGRGLCAVAAFRYLVPSPLPVLPRCPARSLPRPPSAAWVDFAVLMALQFANAIVGFVEEFNAGNAIDALKQQLAPQANVIRGGVHSKIAARELVPGDLIEIKLGACRRCCSCWQGLHWVLAEGRLTGAAAAAGRGCIGCWQGLHRVLAGAASGAGRRCIGCWQGLHRVAEGLLKRAAAAGGTSSTCGAC